MAKTWGEHDSQVLASFHREEIGAVGVTKTIPALSQARPLRWASKILVRSGDELSPANSQEHITVLDNQEEQGEA